MAPAKPRSGVDDHKADVAASKDKNGHSHTNTGGHHAATNGKSRRAAASNTSAAATAAAATTATTAAASAAAAAAATTETAEHQLANAHNGAADTAMPLPTSTPPTIQWMEFERDVLHAYVRTYQIESPSAFSNDLHRWMLSQPGSVGLQSPTMRRRKNLRRQSKTQLANTTRKHSNNLGVQENDVIVDFLHKVQNHEVVRLRRLRRNGSNSRGREG